MALTNETIAAGRSNNASIKNNCSQMIDYCIDIDTIIKGDSDFKIFSEKTGFGDTIGKSLNNLFLLIKSNVSQSIEKITGETDRFLNYQEELNLAKLNFENSQTVSALGYASDKEVDQDYSNPNYEGPIASIPAGPDSKSSQYNQSKFYYTEFK